MKKFLPYIFILIIIVELFTPTVKTLAQTKADTITDTTTGKPTPQANTQYKLLEPLPCTGTKEEGCVGGKLVSFDPTSKAGETNTKLGEYLNIIIKLFIGLCAVLAVVMIVIGGIEYSTSELISSKEAGKDRIRNALLGLLLALGAYTILFTINPDLLNTDIGIGNITLTSEGEVLIKEIDIGSENLNPATQFQTANRTDLQRLGILCPGTGGSATVSEIAQSFIGRSTYNQARRGTTDGTTAYIDCSSFVSQVYTCAGLKNPGGTSVGIFNSSGCENITSISADRTAINGIPLKIGDLIGRPDPDGSNGGKTGHVMMYMGNGKIIDTLSPSKGVAIRPLGGFIGKITCIKRI